MMIRYSVLPRVLNVFMLVLIGIAIVSMLMLPVLVKNYVTYVYLVTGFSWIKGYFLTVLYGCGLLAIVVLWQLMKIFQSCIEENPFIMRNVKSLKIISLCAGIIGLIFVTKAIFFFTFLTLVVIFVFSLAACFCLVLADVFEQAVNYKLDHDLTI